MNPFEMLRREHGRFVLGTGGVSLMIQHNSFNQPSHNLAIGRCLTL